MTFARSLLLAVTLSFAPVAGSASPFVAAPAPAAQSRTSIEIAVHRPGRKLWFEKAVAHILEHRSLVRRAR